MPALFPRDGYISGAAVHAGNNPSAYKVQIKFQSETGAKHLTLGSCSQQPMQIMIYCLIME